MTSSEQDVIIDLPPSHLEEDAGDELNAAQLGESSKNEKSSGKRSKVEDSTTTEARHLLELESQTESELGPKEKKRMKRAFKKKSKMEDSNNTKISELRSETKEFLHTIHKYLDCREKMDAKYLEVDELQTIAKFQLTTDSGGIETDSDDKFEYKTEYQQQSIKAEPVKTLQELYAAAEIS
jgi:predicted nucleic acid-binding protein